MHSLVVMVMAVSWKERCAFLAVAAAVSDSVPADGQVQGEMQGCLTTARISASHPLADKDSRLDFVVCPTLTHLQHCQKVPAGDTCCGQLSQYKPENQATAVEEDQSIPATPHWTCETRANSPGTRPGMKACPDPAG